MAIISRKYNFVGGTTVDPLQMNAELNQLINAHNDHDQNKVDKIAGKGLSTNDFTDQYKSDADANTLARHTHGNKTLLDTYTQSETDLSDAVTKKHFHSNKTVLDQILGVTTVLGNDPTKVPSEKAVAEEIANHVEDNNNPHAVTKSQVGLGNVNNTSDMDKPISTAMQAALDGKVDKVTGKGLSTYDYDSTEKDKVTANTLARHSHSNKALLDTYTQSNDDLAGAVANRHTHSNKSVLDSITGVTQVLGSATNKVPSEKAVVDAMAASGMGDMMRSVYDQNDNGIVDNAEKVNGHTVESDVPAGAVFTDTVTPVIDSLDSDSSTSALSAKQGKALGDLLSTKLPLTGGAVSGYITILNGQRLNLGSTGTKLGHISHDSQNLRIVDETNANNLSRLYLNNSLSLNERLRIMDTLSGSTSTYNIYGTHNVTISTSAPGSALAEGAIHMTY